MSNHKQEALALPQLLLLVAIALAGQAQGCPEPEQPAVVSAQLLQQAALLLNEAKLLLHAVGFATWICRTQT
jgi:hypothetical protein